MTTALFRCTRCKTNTIHLEQEDGSYICRLCGLEVTEYNARIAMQYMEALLDLPLKREAE